VAYFFGPPCILFNTNSGSSLTHISSENLDTLTRFDQILFINTSNAFLNLYDFCNITVSQGNVAMPLRCGGIYND